MSAPDVSIVIPSWNTREYLAACLESVDRAPKPTVELIVVENGSEDGSREYLERERPDVRLVVNARNEGFARACNQGIELARGRYVLLLNTDTQIRGDALLQLFEFLEEHPDYGCAAPRLVHPDGSTQRTVQAFPNLKTPLFFATPFERWFPDSSELRRYFLRDWDQESSRDVDQPPAAALLVRADVLAEVGTFDEVFWLFFNDVDLSMRIGRAGYRTRYLAEAEVLHHVGGSTRKFAAFVPEWQRNRLAFYRKHFGRAAGLWVKACTALAYSDWLARGLGARLRGREAEPLGPTTREFLRFLAG